MSSCWLAFLARSVSTVGVRAICQQDKLTVSLSGRPPRLKSETDAAVARTRTLRRVRDRRGSCGCTCLEAESAKLHFNRAPHQSKIAFSAIYLLSPPHKQASLALCECQRERTIASLIILLLNSGVISLGRAAVHPRDRGVPCCLPTPSFSSTFLSDQDTFLLHLQNTDSSSFFFLALINYYFMMKLLGHRDSNVLIMD